MNYRNSFHFWCHFLTILWLKSGIVQGIIGGFQSSGTITYTVSIQAHNEHVCGGAIIGPWHILTAAHCIIDEVNIFINQKFTVLAGVYNLEYNIPVGMRVDVETFYVPAEYDPLDRVPMISFYRETGDIAVLKLKHMLPLGANFALSALKLPESIIDNIYFLYYDKYATISGFGSDSVQIRGVTMGDQPFETARKNVMLKFSEVIIGNRETCGSMYPFSIDEKLICARVVLSTNEENIEGVCHGDGGGPLVFNGDTIIGVLAQHRRDCNEHVTASIYTRVSSYIPFIYQAVNNIRTDDIRIAEYKIRTEAVGTSQGREELFELSE